MKDLFENIKGVKYFRYEEKIKLGKKRNLLHEKSKGDIIVYMVEVDLVVMKVVKVVFVLFGGVLIVLREHFQLQTYPKQQYGHKIIRI